MPTVWLSFAAEDRPLMEALHEHLAVFRNQGVLELVSTEAQASASPDLAPHADRNPGSIGTLGTLGILGIRPDFHPDIILLMLSRRYLVGGNLHLQKALELYHGHGIGTASTKTSGQNSGHAQAPPSSQSSQNLRRPILLTVLLGPTLWESTSLATLAPPLLDARPVSAYQSRDDRHQSHRCFAGRSAADIRGRYSVIAMQGRQPDEKIDELIAQSRDRRLGARPSLPPGP